MKLDRYSRTRRCSRSLHRTLADLAFWPIFIEQIDELEDFVLLWRDVAFRRGPGRKIATRCLTIGFSHLSHQIHLLLAVDKSRIDPRELVDLENISPETVAALPSAAKRIAEEGLAFLETQSQSSKRISELRFLWLVGLGNVEEFADNARVGEARGRIVRELKCRLASPRLSRDGALELLATLVKLEPDFEPEPSVIDLLQRIVDHPESGTTLEWALYLQVRFGLEIRRRMHPQIVVLFAPWSQDRGSGRSSGRRIGMVLMKLPRRNRPQGSFIDVFPRPRAGRGC